MTLGQEEPSGEQPEYPVDIARAATEEPDGGEHAAEALVAGPAATFEELDRWSRRWTLFMVCAVGGYLAVRLGGE